MKKNIDRREFFKTAGTAAMAMGGLGVVAGCKGSGQSAAGTSGSNEPAGEMTYRTNRVT